MSTPQAHLAAFARARAQLSTQASLAGLAGEIGRIEGLLGEPMRVAIVGLIKKGKSTLMNALLGDRLVATGVEELTFNVNWFRQAREPSLTAVLRDGTRLVRPLAELEQLTARGAEGRKLLQAIGHIEIGHPNPLLARFELVDTPGLDSVFERDSRNAAEFLGITAGEVRERTVEASVGAHAVLYLFTRASFTPSDREALDAFQRGDRPDLTPLNAIAVLNRVGQNWPSVDDPMADARSNLAALREGGGLAARFFAIVPVCALLAEGAQTADEGTLAMAADLARRPPEWLREGIRYGFRGEDDAAAGLAPGAGEALRARFGQWGLWRACELAREGAEGEELRGALVEESGVGELRRVVVDHFGRRASLVKLEAALLQAQAVLNEARREARGDEARAIALVAGGLQELAAAEQGVRELAALRDHYAGRVPLREAQVEDLLLVTGEHGASLAARAGHPDRVSIDASLRDGLRGIGDTADQKAERWRRAQEEPRYGMSADQIARHRELCRVMWGSFERLSALADDVQERLGLDGPGEESRDV